jgi:acetylglutamate kinase
MTIAQQTREPKKANNARQATIPSLLVFSMSFSRSNIHLVSTLTAAGAGACALTFGDFAHVP